jgi:hypothetical protein
MERKDLRVKTDLSVILIDGRRTLRIALLNIPAMPSLHPKGDIIVKMYSQQGFLEISVTNSFEKLAESLTRILTPSIGQGDPGRWIRIGPDLTEDR